MNLNLELILSVGLGFIGAVIFQVVMEFIINKFKNDRKVKDLIVELKINKEKIEKWILKLEELKERVIIEDVKDFPIFLDYQNFIITTINLLHRDGLLYRKLDHYQVEELQDMMNYFSPSMGSVVNNKITECKDDFDKKEFMVQVNYNLITVKKHKGNLEKIISKLEK